MLYKSYFWTLENLTIKWKGVSCITEELEFQARLKDAVMKTKRDHGDRSATQENKTEAFVEIPLLKGAGTWKGGVRCLDSMHAMGL